MDKNLINPNLYDEKYYLDESYAGAREYKQGLKKLAPSVDWIYKQISPASKNQKFLDAGCGKGELLYFMAKKGYEAYGIDYSRTAIKMAKRLLKNKKVKGKVILSDVKKTPFPNHFFSIIMSTDVIEHLDNEMATAEFLNEMYRLLKPGGKIYIHTAPNKLYVDFFRKYYQRYFNLLILGIIRLFGKYKSYNPQNILAVRSSYELIFHINEQTVFSLKKILRRSYFKKYKIKIFSDPFIFNPFKLPYYLLGYFFPLNKLFPFNIILGSHFYVYAEK